MADRIDISALQAGDVLLYHGRSFLSRLIRLFDGGNFSHASIFDGVHVMEALGDGINTRSIQESIGDAAYVDVFRFSGDTGQQLGSPNLPLDPLQRAIREFENTSERYAYEEILLLAVLGSTRRLPLPPGIGIIVRNLLDSAADLVTDLTAAGKQPVICSELVFRCYLNAGENYKILIRGADPTAMAQFAYLGAPLSSDPESTQVAQSAQNFLARYALAKHPEIAASKLLTADALTALAVADFVTPHDLEVSPSLLRLGTLQSGATPAMVLSFPAVSTISKTSLQPEAALQSAPVLPTLVGNGEFHKSLLIVKTRLAPPDTSPASMMNFIANQASGPGMTVLSYFDKSNKIKRITPLARRHPRPLRNGVSPGTYAAAMLMTAPVDAPEDANRGVSLVEMESEQDALLLRDELAKDPSIEFVSQVPIRYALATPVTGPAPLWNLETIQWPQAQTKIRSSAALNIAVLDTGIDSAHPALAARVAQYIFDHPGIPGASSDQDLVGHGTHVSGTIAALIGANGMQGICDCRLHVWKIFNDQPVLINTGFGMQFAYIVDPGMYARALADCLEADIAAINLSIGGPGKPDPQELDLFQRLIQKGVAVVAAMGNSRQLGSPTSYPAAIAGVIAVGASDASDQVASFSSAGPHIALVAPGKGILSTLPTYPGQFGFQTIAGPSGPIPGAPLSRGTLYAAWDGTSMATPHVTASVAALIATRGRLSPADIRARLQQESDAVGGMHGAAFNNDYGSGRLNLARLL